jgi:hypothetical protein
MGADFLRHQVPHTEQLLVLLRTMRPSHMDNTESQRMNQAQQTFEAIMRIDGHTDFTFRRGKYANASLQIRWRWFQTGWELRGLAK